MVAVAPFLEESLTDAIDDEAQRLVYKIDAEPAPMAGLGATKKDPLENPAQAVDITHQNLARMVAAREVANRLLDGRTISVAFFDSKALLVVEPAIGRDEAPPWTGLSADWRGAKLLSWVSKMQCPSYSLPAGAFENGGSCVAASLGQTVADQRSVDNLIAKEDILRKTVGKVERLSANALPLWYALATCQTCYAEKGPYSYFSNVLNSVASLAWTKWAIATPSSSGSGKTVFVETLIRAIENADYGTATPADRAHLAAASASHGLEPAVGYKRFFRWHDAGDVISLRYFEQLKQVSDHFNPRKAGAGSPTLFWLPTRLWAVKAAAGWAKVNDDPRSNIVVRPSAFHVNFPAPTKQAAGPGNDAGTTTIAADLAEEYQGRGYFDIDCPAATKTSDCRTEQCRACWVKPDLVINYRLH